MHKPRWRGADGVLPLWGWVALALAVGGAVTIVVIGANEQDQRRIPAVTSATLERHVGFDQPGSVGPISVGAVEATRLVNGLNALPHFPSGQMHCGLSLGTAYRVHFVAVRGSPIDVSLAEGGCLGVDVSSSGQDWLWLRWDPTGVVVKEIAKDLGLG